ncbi:MAG: DUF3667 domain-containing protein [Candidatus Cloacimonetes bacterium]|nr:DUF3667 domain-containing protein [Candidatus Cloacimonadota bacterium]
MSLCKKCKNEFQGNYCPNCGQPLKVERINGRYFLSEIGSILNLEKGFFHTIKELLIRPGHNIKLYISEDRSKLVKPILFIIICSLIYALFVQFFDFQDEYIDLQIDVSGSSVNLLFQWLTKNYGYLNILMSVFVAIWIQIFYRKYDFNIYEILIMLLYISGMQMLMFSFLGAVGSLTKTKVLSYAANLIFIYAFWATGQFFDKRKILNYLKAPVSYLLGLITFFIVTLGIGLLIDFIK